MSQLTDTPPHVEQIVAACYRRMSAERKWKVIGDAYRFGRHLHAVGTRQRNPGLSETEINRICSAQTLGDGPWLPGITSHMQNQPAEHQQAIRDVIEAFDQERISYAIGGSLASSLHGYPRYTQDADLTAEPFAGKEQAFVSHFHTDEWYFDLQMIRDANASRGSFNLVHYGSGFKIDVFIRGDRAFDLSYWSRKHASADFDRTGRPVEVISAEDIALLKLEWYRLGGEQSDRQWNDILGVLRTQGARLDDAYLDYWAAQLNVTDLLTKMRKEA